MTVVKTRCDDQCTTRVSASKSLGSFRGTQKTFEDLEVELFKGLLYHFKVRPSSTQEGLHVGKYMQPPCQLLGHELSKWSYMGHRFEHMESENTNARAPVVPSFRRWDWGGCQKRPLAIFEDWKAIPEVGSWS